SKQGAELYLGLFNRLYGTRHVVLRYSNVYGPRQDPHGEAGVVAIFFGKLASGATPLIFGDGRQTRDYVYVGDVVAANMAALAAGARRVVNTSTGGGLYGDADLLPTPEGHPIAPLAPYGQSKLAAEGYCELYARLHGLSTISLRYGNVYGSRQDVHGEAGVVAIFCGCLVEGRTPTVFGDGRQTRDWVDVSDVVRANLLAAASDLTGPVNIGHGRETSVLDLLDALGEAAGDGARPMTPELQPARPGEVRRSCLDVTRARERLGWEPTVSLPDGLRTILAGL
ncbi:MAG: NAD-dependent epimerase/dehydratase family protein, partial [Solirubrobacteraceae bacterium]